ncbi:MAG: hypothetical protein B7Z52_07700, partial [Burkholderiales bacterium 12-64-5]
MIRSGDTRAPPTATSFRPRGTGAPASAAATSAVNICGSRMTLSGCQRCSAASAARTSKLLEPCSPTSASDGTTHSPSSARATSAPATFSSSTASGSMHRWRRIPSSRATCTSEPVTADSCAAVRQTPLGWPVVPDVKVIFVVIDGTMTADSLRRVHIDTPDDDFVSALSPRRAARDGSSVSSTGAPAASSACRHCASVKNVGSGSATRLARRIARSLFQGLLCLEQRSGRQDPWYRVLLSQGRVPESQFVG